MYNWEKHHTFFSFTPLRWGDSNHSPFTVLVLNTITYSALCRPTSCCRCFCSGAKHIFNEFSNKCSIKSCILQPDVLEGMGHKVRCLGVEWQCWLNDTLKPIHLGEISSLSCFPGRVTLLHAIVVLKHACVQLKLLKTSSTEKSKSCSIHPRV